MPGKSSKTKKKSSQNKIKPGISLQAQRKAFLVILGISIFLVAFTLFKYITTAVIGLIIVGAFYPLLNLLLKKTGWSRKIWSSILSALIFLIIVVPVLFITIQLTGEVLKTYQFFQSGKGNEIIQNILFGEHFVADSMRWLSSKLGFVFTPDEVGKWLNTSIKTVLLKTLNSLNSLVSNIFSFLFSLILMQIFIYAMFLEGPRLKAFFLKLFPLNETDVEAILKTINTMNFTTLVYNGIGGLIQGILAGIGFWIAGFDSVILWTIIMIILAFIPLVGISIVTIPASIFLFIQGQSVGAIALFVYCSMVALATENLFKPTFMGKHVQINPFLMFFSIIGGMSAFGVVGIFYGPIIIAVFLTVTEMYFKKLAPT